MTISMPPAPTRTCLTLAAKVATCQITLKCKTCSGCVDHLTLHAFLPQARGLPCPTHAPNTPSLMAIRSGLLGRCAVQICRPLPPHPALMSLQFHRPNAVSAAGTRPALSLLNNWTYCSKKLCSLSFLFLVWREKQRKERRWSKRTSIFSCNAWSSQSHGHCLDFLPLLGWGWDPRWGAGTPSLGKELLTEVVLILCVRGPRVQAFEGSDEG